MTKLIRPNARLTDQGWWILIAVEVCVAFGVWALAPLALLPTPGEVLRAFPVLWRQGLGAELWASFLVNVEALAITALLALGLSYLTVLPLVRPIAAAVSKLRFLGLVGLTFLFTVLFAGGHALKVSLLVFGMTVFFVTSMADAVDGIAREEFDHARTLRMGPWRAVGEVVVLGRADLAFDVFRQNAAIGWVLLTTTEGLVRSGGGLGAMLLNQSKHLHLAEVFAINAVILATGMCIDAAIGYSKRLLCPYAFMGRERL